MSGNFTRLFGRGLVAFSLCALAAGAPAAGRGPAAAAAQAKKGFAGSWEWKSRPNGRKEQAAFWVYVRQRGNRVSGTLSFAMLVDGENDGSDSSSLPFVGTVSGETASIEFDPNDFHGIEEENPRYVRPRSPSTATLRLKAGKLEWTQTKGPLDTLGLGVPKTFLLSR